MIAATVSILVLAGSLPVASPLPASSAPASQSTSDAPTLTVEHMAGLWAAETVFGKDEGNVVKMREMLMGDDTTYSLAVLLDTKKKQLPHLSCQQIASHLRRPRPKTCSRCMVEVEL